MTHVFRFFPPFNEPLDQVYTKFQVGWIKTSPGPPPIFAPNTLKIVNLLEKWRCYFERTAELCNFSLISFLEYQLHYIAEFSGQKKHIYPPAPLFFHSERTENRQTSGFDRRHFGIKIENQPGPR